MTFNDFYRLRVAVGDCDTYDIFLAEEGGSVDETDVALLAPIYQVRTIKELRALTGLTQAAFAQEYHIPRRTVEDWEAGAAPRDYVFDLLMYAVLSDLDTAADSLGEDAEK